MGVAVGLAGRGLEGEGAQEPSCRVVAGLTASSPSQLGGAAGELLLGTLHCGWECRTWESRDMEPEGVRGTGEEGRATKGLVVLTAEAVLCCFLPTDLALSLLLQPPCPPF